MDLRERLEQRKKDLTDEMNALGGALQQIDWTLAQMAEIERESAEVVEVTE